MACNKVTGTCECTSAEQCASAIGGTIDQWTCKPNPDFNPDHDGEIPADGGGCKQDKGLPPDAGVPKQDKGLPPDVGVPKQDKGLPLDVSVPKQDKGQPTDLPQTGTSISGSINGHQLVAQEALMVLDTAIAGDELLVIQDRSGSCTSPSYSHHQQSTYLFADFMGVGNVTGPGTWSVGSGVIVEFRVLDSSCQPSGAGFSKFAVGGWITLSSVNKAAGGSVAGTLSLDFGSGETLSGSFVSNICTTNFYGGPCLP